MQTPITFREKSFHLAQVRPLSSLPADILNVIDIVTLDVRYPPNIVGSYRYIIHEYPGDIDLFSPYVGTSSLDHVLTFLTRRFKEIIVKIEKHPFLFLSDFKAGLDTRYVLKKLGEIKNNQIHNYDGDFVRVQLRNLFDLNLLTNDELKMCLTLAVNIPTSQEYKTLRKFLHEKATLRWTAAELKKGHKTLSNKSILYLRDALNQKSIVKIDVCMFLFNRFTSIESFFALSYIDSSKKQHLISAPLENYKDILLNDIEKYASPLYYNMMKTAKRIWSLAHLQNDQKLMIKLFPLFSSGAAKMHQILGELNVIKTLIEKQNTIPMEYIRRNLEDWKLRLGTVPVSTLPVNISTSVFLIINKAMDVRLPANTLPYLEEIHDKLLAYVNMYVKRFMKTAGIADIAAK